MSFEKELKKYAKQNNVPIIEDDGLSILLQFIKQIKPNNILEIGTAIGYSALQMNSINNANVYTFERNEKMIEEAKGNFQKYDLNNKIKLYEGDFLNLELTTMIPKNIKFDIIYIDGAKSQYYKFFKKAEPFLSKEGIVIFDNLKFHGYVFNENKKLNASRNLKQMIRKIEKFLTDIKEEEGYSFELLEEGDGIGILRRNNG